MDVRAVIEEGTPLADDCVICGTNPHDDPRALEFYTLSHVYGVIKAGSMEVASPGTGHELTFCSARCLTEYVNEKIAPDAAGE